MRAYTDTSINPFSATFPGPEDGAPPFLGFGGANSHSLLVTLSWKMPQCKLEVII